MVIRQKGESQNGCLEKTKHAKFSEKRTFLTPDTHTYVRNGGKCSLFGKFDMLCFLETTVLRFALFALLPTTYFQEHLRMVTTRHSSFRRVSNTLGEKFRKWETLLYNRNVKFLYIDTPIFINFIFFTILPSNSSIHDSPQQYSFLWMNYLKIWKYNAFQTFHTAKFFNLTFTSTFDCKENW